MSITYELTEDEFEAVRDSSDLVGLVEALACTSHSIEMSRAQLCAFTSVVIGKLRAVLNAAEERRDAQVSLTEASEPGGARNSRALDLVLNKAIADGKISQRQREQFAEIGRTNLNALVKMIIALPAMPTYAGPVAAEPATTPEAAARSRCMPPTTEATRRSVKRSRREAAVA
ncbi:MAG: hypothetical protein ABL916_24345 [Burkholderiaceae bacterium]